jgi:hypothetical protein
MMSAMPIEEKIHTAAQLFSRHGKRLLADDDLRHHLACYQSAIRQTGALMERLGVCAACAACAAGERGSCCSSHVETWYDLDLLLVNLLVGADLAEVRVRPEDCRFQGAAGCNLPARHYFCVHYLCPELRGRLAAEQMAVLVRAVGQEMAAAAQVERILRLTVCTVEAGAR